MKKGQKVVKCADCGKKKVVEGDAIVVAPFRCEACAMAVQEVVEAQTDLIDGATPTNPRVVDLEAKAITKGDLSIPDDVPDDEYDELKEQLYTLNEDLRTAKSDHNNELAEALKDDIRDAVKDSGGLYIIDKHGYAVQAKPTKPVRAISVPIKTTLPAERRLCPCCGQEVQSLKAWFLTGHDGRLHGMFVKADKGKLDTATFLDTALAIYHVWKEDKTLSMKEAAARAALKLQD